MFTALFTYQGRQHIRQINANDAKTASHIWGKAMQASGTLRAKTEHTEAVLAPKTIESVTMADDPIALKGMDNVYTQVLTFSDAGDYGVLTLVKTKVPRREYSPVEEIDENIH